MPVPVKEVRDAAAFGQVHHERVAIDVVPGVLVVQRGKVGAFELGAFAFLVPVDRDGMAVGVE